MEKRFVQSQPQLYMDMKEHYPDLNARIIAAMATSRWETQGASWVEADTTHISGESLIRQILYRTRIFQQDFGVELEILWLPDAAGYSGALPQVLRGCGIRYCLIPGNDLETFPHHTFWWEGIDGSRVLTRILPADAHAGINLPEQFKEQAWVGELYFECRRGARTSQAESKWENHRCEFLLRDAEFLAAIRPGGGAEYPRAELDEAWELLLNQSHDNIPDLSTGRIGQPARVREIGEGAVATSLDAFTALLDTGDLCHPLAVWNTLSFPRSGLVSVPWKGKSDVNAFAPRGQASRTQITEENGERRLLVEVVDVPPMGYIVYDLRERARVKESALAITDVARTDDRVLENELVRVELNACGEVVSYLDKQLDRQIIAPGAAGNRFQLVDDCDAGDLYDEVCEELDAPAVIEPVENGPLRATVRVERQLTPQAHLVQFIRLEANSRRLDFETCLAWHEPHALLKVAFPVTIHSPWATCEIQFGHLDRPTHRNTSRDIARFEVCAHKWIDLSEGDYGVALLNDGNYGSDVKHNVLRLRLLRAPNYPDERADIGSHPFTYSLLPHRGKLESSGVPLAGYDLNVPFHVRMLPVQHGMLARAHSYFRVDKPNLVIEAVKRAEDGDGLIVRLFEAYRRRGSARLLVNGLCSRATRTDLLERNLHDLPVQGGAVAFEYRPFEIITLRLR
jgi:alpha-mannosidase